MKPIEDVYIRMQERLLHECRRVRSTTQEMQELAPAYNKYVDLDRELDSHRHRMHIILGLFGPNHVAELAKGDACVGETLGGLSPQYLRNKLRLWRAIREYVRVAGESKVGDIQAFLMWIGIENVTRQAIESALKQHKDEFAVTKRGHERYVALR